MFTEAGTACNFIKKENLAQVFSYEFCEISKNTFFTEQNTSGGCFCVQLELSGPHQPNWLIKFKALYREVTWQFSGSPHPE